MILKESMHVISPEAELDADGRCICDGIFYDTERCDIFYSCGDQRLPTQMTCPASLIFNAATLEVTLKADLAKIYGEHSASFVSNTLYFNIL